jgi:hypothetical protein
VELERALVAMQAQSSNEAEGMVVYKLYRLMREVQWLYRLRDQQSRGSEFPCLCADLLKLSRREESPGDRLELVRRMVRNYTVFQP